MWLGQLVVDHGKQATDATFQLLYIVVHPTSSAFLCTYWWMGHLGRCMPCKKYLMLTWLTCTPFFRGGTVKWGCPWRAHRRYDWRVDVLCGNQRLGWHGMIFRWWGEDGSKQKKRFIFNRRGWGLWEIEWFDLQVWSSANLTSYDVRLSSLFKSSRWNKKKWEPKGPQKPSFLLELWRLKEERLFFPLVFGTQNYTKPVILSVQHAHDAWFVFTFAGLNPWFAIKGFW